MTKLLLTILIICCTLFIGCESCQKGIKHLKSSTIGIQRQVTLYSYSGVPIKQWSGRFTVELNGNAAAWIGDNGKEVKIAGIFIIEEQ